MTFTSLPRRPPRVHPAHCILPRLLLATLVLQAGLPACAGSVQLVPGDTLERAIEEKEIHAYPVRLAAGDFLRVTVDQEAVDLEVKLAAPDGTTAALVDGPEPASDYGTEDLAAVAGTSGLYTVLVQATLKNAPRPHYRIRMEAPRPAREEDRRRAEAVQANQEATNGMAADPRLPLPRQAELREKALRIWHDLGEVPREADTLLQLGLVRSDLGETGEASRLLHQAAGLYEKLGDRVGEAKALNEAARFCERTGHTDEALREYRRAVDLSRAAGARWAQVNALVNLGILLNHQGKPREAVAALSEALKLSDGLACDGCQGSILVSLGSAHDSLSETQTAIGFYKQALRLEGIKPEDGAGAHNDLGLAYQALGNPEEALPHFQKADELHRNPSTLCNLGLTLESLERFDDALASYRSALELARRPPADPRVQVTVLHNLGYLYLRLGRKEAALAAWDGMGKLAADRKELEPLLLFTRAAAKRARGDQGDREGAARDLERSLALSRERGDLGWAAMSSLELARVERESGRLAEALGHFRSAVETVESLRTQVLDPDLRALFLGSRQRYYEQYVDTLMELHGKEPDKGWDVQALQVAEGARARSLLDLLGEIRANLRTGVDPKLLQKAADRRAEVNARDLQRLELIHQGASPAEVDRASASLEESISRLDEVEADLRQGSRGYAALTQPQPLDAPAIQSQVVGDGALLLEYSLGEPRSYLWVVTPAAVRSFTLPGRERIEKAALDFYEKVARKDAAPAAVDAAALGLSRMILGPAEGLLGASGTGATGAGTLLVVGDGVLQYIPFSALPLPSAPQERLLARHALVSLPSASTLAVLRQEPRTAAPKTLALLADPVFGNDPRALHARPAGDRTGDEAATYRGVPPPRGAMGRSADLLLLDPLPFSREEAAAIGRMVPDKEQKLEALGFDASVDTARSGKLAEYRYVHFATHGILDTWHPGLSRLALSQLDRNGRPQDGFLRLQDIYNLQLNADLVVLSACQTALGKEIRGEGLIGLTRGFMYAGSARVLASLWSVEDRATAKLMEKLYRHLLVDKQSPAESLRRAQLDLARDRRWAAPYYWAGFSLQGEWK
jgi:CHAT domain-containing protein/tetratricopeptide (TPR) repeat protein